MNSMKLLALGAFLVGSVAVYGNQPGAKQVDTTTTTTHETTTETTQAMSDAQAKAECLKANPKLKGAELEHCIKSKTKAE